MVVVFSVTAGLTGLEIGVAGGTAVVGQGCWKRFSVRTPSAGSQSPPARTSTPAAAADQGGTERFLARLDVPAEQQAEAMRSLAEKLHAVGAENGLGGTGMSRHRGKPRKHPVGGVGGAP